MNKRIFIFILLSVLYGQRTIAILDFEAVNISESEAYALTERFRSEIQRLDGRNMYLERNRMEEILKEQGFQQSGCTSTECAVEIGKILGAQDIITGSIALIGQTYSVNIRMIDVESSTITKTISRVHTGLIDNLLTTEIPNVALEFLGIPVYISKDTEIPVALNSIRSMAKRDASEDMNTYHWMAGSGCVSGCGSWLRTLILPIIAATIYVGYSSYVDIPDERLNQIDNYPPEVRDEYIKAYRKEVRRIRGKQALIGAVGGLVIVWLLF